MYFPRSLFSALLFCSLLLPIPVAHAGSATWNTNAGSNSWNTATNWTPTTVPNGQEDLATFDISNATNLILDTDIDLAGMAFHSGASAYTFTLPVGSTLTFFGDGITNDSGQLQTFLLSIRTLNFHNDATAGSQTLLQAGKVFFYDNATAGEATFQTIASSIEFHDNSSADHGIFVNGGFSQRPLTVNGISFFDQSSAGEGYFVDNASTRGLENNGSVYIAPDATADAATVVNMPATFAGGLAGTMTIDGAGANGTFTALGSNAGGAAAGEIKVFGRADNASYTATGGTNGGNGGTLFFSQGADGGTARCTVMGNATMKIGTTDGIGLSIGSLEGDGLVFLTTLGFGEKQLTVGTNNLDAIFSGVVADGVDQTASAGTLLKTGSGTFTLAGASTYTGGTTVNGGMLLVTNTTGSATGTGAVAVDAGTLGGSGTIAGTVTIGTGASLAPAGGTQTQATLGIQSSLTSNAGSTYTYTFKATRKHAKTDKVLANGVTINSSASFNLSGQTQGTLIQGLVLTVIRNTAATPIAGTFSNLPDGAIVNVSGNNLQASYEGGDGNDLTLTVVP